MPTLRSRASAAPARSTCFRVKYQNGLKSASETNGTVTVTTVSQSTTKPHTPHSPVSTHPPSALPPAARIVQAEHQRPHESGQEPTGQRGGDAVGEGVLEGVAVVCVGRWV